MSPFIKAVMMVDRAMARVETWIIVGVVSLMLLLTTAMAVLKLGGLAIIQFEEIARYLVIWVGFMGGAIAAHQSRHINIDLFTRFLKGRPRRMVMGLVWLTGFSIAVVMLVTSVSYVFTSEFSLYRTGDIAVSFGEPGHMINVSGWLMAVVMPGGLGLIALHMLAGAIYAMAGVDGPGHSGPVPIDVAGVSTGDDSAQASTQVAVSGDEGGAA